MKAVIIDAGPLVALLARCEPAHFWAQAQAASLPSPLHTCEAVITEAAHLLRRARVDETILLRMIERSVLQISYSLSEDLSATRALMETYKNVPMSFADACVVRMSEALPDCVVFTLDRDFRIYRRHRTQLITLVAPAGV